MKKAFQILIAVVTMFVILMLDPVNQLASAQNTKSAIKIGTYDSRVVAFSWSRSEYFNQHMIKFRQQSDSAEKVHDTARLKELSIGIMSHQHLMHQIVFSNGSIGFIMAIVKDKLPELAKSTGVNMILSKWELPFRDPSVEIIDLTYQVAALFKPKERIEKMAGEISRQGPLPLNEFDIEAELLDYYCQKFGKK
jgi:hypothetical protein